MKISKLTMLTGFVIFCIVFTCIVPNIVPHEDFLSGLAVSIFSGIGSVILTLTAMFVCGLTYTEEDFKELEQMLDKLEAKHCKDKNDKENF